MILGVQVEKFEISEKDNPSNKLEACFNPNTLSLTYGANWSEKKKRLRNVQDVEFGSSESATLEVELMFDTYSGANDTVRDVHSLEDIRSLKTEEKNVAKRYIQKLVSLTRIHGKLHRPPICKIKWGEMTWSTDATSSTNEFYCILTRLSVKYSLFLADGTPVRATASCSFKQWRDKEEDVKSINSSSPDVNKRHVVRRGDTLAGLSAEYYNSPSHWRLIAEHNRLSNPRELTPGKVLMIPILDE